jgi:hypothetical protein
VLSQERRGCLRGRRTNVCPASTTAEHLVRARELRSERGDVRRRRRRRDIDDWAFHGEDCERLARRATVSAARDGTAHGHGLGCPVERSISDDECAQCVRGARNSVGGFGEHNTSQQNREVHATKESKARARDAARLGEDFERAKDEAESRPVGRWEHAAEAKVVAMRI